MEEGAGKVVWPEVRRTRFVGIDRTSNELRLISLYRDRCHEQSYLNLTFTW